MPESKWDNSFNRLAVIDLGSNTFHLIIVQLNYPDNTYTLLKRQRDFVYLSRDGMDYFTEHTIERALSSLKNFKSLVELYNVSAIRAIGTAAMRTAKNASVLREMALKNYGINIEIFSGQRESELIHKGTLFTPRKNEQAELILDIGGGSVEFIIAKNQKVVHWNSAPVGISILKNKFRMENQMQLNQSRVNTFLTEHLKNEIYKINKFAPSILKGAAGPFEILEVMSQKKPSTTGNYFDTGAMRLMASKILSSNVEQRKSIPLMPHTRSDLALESFFILEFILERCECIKEICVTPFALKEGVVFEELQNNNCNAAKL